MKKTLVALAVAALAATSANAAVVYNQDGTKLDINGSVRVLLEKSTGSRTNLQNDDSRVNFAASQDLGNGLSAVGYLRLKVDGEDFNGLEVNKLYAGLAHQDIGTVTFGRQDTNADDVQLGDYATFWGGNTPLTTSADKAIKFRSVDFAGLSFGADYLFGNKDKEGTGRHHGFGLGAFYTGNFADNVTLNVNAGYTYDKFTPVTGNALTDLQSALTAYKATQSEENLAKVLAAGKKVLSGATTFSDKVENANNVSDVISAFKAFSKHSKSWDLATEVLAGPMAFGVSYGQSKLTFVDDSSAHIKALLVGAKYDVTEATNVYAQYNRTHAKYKELDIRTTVNGYIAGVGYKLSNNVNTYAEYARFKEIGEKADNKFGVGLRVSF